MGKPIYRVIVDFEYRNKSRGNYSKTKIKKGTIDTFALSRDDNEIYEYIKGRIFRQIKKREQDIEVEVKNIIIRGQHGETNY
jgi:hypothetical protein